jgi:hypothetical protein
MYIVVRYVILTNLPHHSPPSTYLWNRAWKLLVMFSTCFCYGIDV